MSSVSYFKLSGGNSNNQGKACGPYRRVYLPSPKIKIRAKHDPRMHHLMTSQPQYQHFINSNSMINNNNNTSSNINLHQKLAPQQISLSLNDSKFIGLF